MPHANLTANTKKALREASARCQTNGTLPGKIVTVWVLGICDTDPFIAGLVETQEHALELIDGVVFLVETARFGIKHHTQEGYVPLDAQDFVRSLTKSIDSPAEAFAILMPYFEAVHRLP